MSKVLVVTDYNGNLHIVPPRNKAYYQKQNSLNKKQQFTFQEMEGGAIDAKGNWQDGDAEQYVIKNKGRDPNFVRPADTKKVIAEKDALIEDLKKQLAATQGSSSGTSSDQSTAKEVIEKVKAATTAEEVQAIAGNDTRATVIAAVAAKLDELKKA